MSEAKDLHAQRARLTHQQAKLLQAHYAGAVPLDLLKTEQERIASSLERIDERLAASQAGFDKIEANLAATLGLLNDCQRTYQQASSSTRRLTNQAFFVKLYLDDLARACGLIWLRRLTSCCENNSAKRSVPKYLVANTAPSRC